MKAKIGKCCITILLLLLIISGMKTYNFIFPKAKSMELPVLEKISSIEIKKGAISTEHRDKEIINTIINGFFKAKPTRNLTIHDTPSLKEYYAITFISEGDDRVYTSFIYNEDAKWYIEQPYYGVYEIKEELFDFIVTSYQKN